MLARVSRRLVLENRNLHQCPTSRSTSFVQIRFDSGFGSAQVKNVDIVRKSDKISEILNKVKNRDGLTKQNSHVEHLAGRFTVDTTDRKNRTDMAGLDIGDKTEIILQSCHPVRYTLEREMYDASRTVVSYHNWMTLFGRGIRVTKNPQYDELLDLVSKACDSGMFSSVIHETVVNIPEKANEDKTEVQFSLGNKYAILVGDYFAIRCIYFVEKTKNSKVVMAITKGVEESATAHFASKILDQNIIYPFLPYSNAKVNEWIIFNKKISGYFNGGVYAMLMINYGKLPGNEEFMKNLKLFSSNLSLLIRGVAELEAFENAEDLSTNSPHTLTTLPAILYQQKNPRGFDYLRRKKFTLHNVEDFKKLTEDIERSSAIEETKFILGGIASEAKRSFEKISADQFYSDVVHDLIDAVTHFD